MRPVLFKLFGINIYSYGTMMAVGVFAAVLLLGYRAKKSGYNEDHILDMSIITVICGLVGSKVLYIITDLKNIIYNPLDLKNIIGGGFVVYGSIIGGALGVYAYCRKRNWEVFKILDLAAPPVMMAQGFGRIGCFLTGCCYGRPTTSIFGVVFKNSFYAPAGVKLIPTQLYSSAFDFIVSFFLLWLSRKERKEGRIFSLYVIIYSIGRFIIEFYRGDSYRGFVGVLSTSQFISIFTVIIGILIFFKDRIFKAKEN